MRAFLLRITPTRWMSRLTGILARTPIPRPLRKPIFRIFSRIYGVKLPELADPLEHFRSMSEFFIRRLKPEARPLDTNPEALLSPVDGRIVSAGPLTETKRLEIKGGRYTPAELLHDEEEAKRWEGGTQVTLYLCPGDYHRIHAPLSGAVTRWRHIPGRLLPVNPQTLKAVDKVFPTNERVVSYWEEADRNRTLVMVMVGALNVGSIHTRWDPALRTNTSKSTDSTFTADAPRRFYAGEESAWFQFGSTVVLVLPPGAVTLEDLRPGKAVKMGERLGGWNPKE